MNAQDTTEYHFVCEVMGVDAATLEREIEAEWIRLRDQKEETFRGDAVSEGVALAQVDGIEHNPFVVESSKNNLDGILTPVIVKIAVSVGTAVTMKALEVVWRKVIEPSIARTGRSVSSPPGVARGRQS